MGVVVNIFISFNPFSGDMNLPTNGSSSDIIVKLSDNIILDYHIDLLDLFAVNIELLNKHYTTKYETAVIIKRLSIDNIELIPRYDYLARYINDHDNNNPTSYLGFNGKWTLTIDCPFYHWLHRHSGQGLLIG
jgi:hypothetical protein